MLRALAVIVPVCWILWATVPGTADRLEERGAALDAAIAQAGG